MSNTIPRKPHPRPLPRREGSDMLFLVRNNKLHPQPLPRREGSDMLFLVRNNKLSLGPSSVERGVM